MFYRLRKRLCTTRYWLAARGVYGTRPTPCEPLAACTIHTMLGQADLLMYLIAIKSFLRFQPAARVAAHSDGTLTDEHAALLRTHIPGIRVIAAPEADARAKKSLNPFLAEWRSCDPCWRRLIDTELWCETPRRIIMDSDILTLRRPDAVLEWIAGASPARPLLFGAIEEKPAGPLSEGSGNRHVQTVFRERLASLAAGANLPAAFYQGGTAGYYGCTGEISLEAIERVTRAAAAAGIPMAEWGGDQCLVVYLLSVSDPILLDGHRYMNFSPEGMTRLDEAAVIHFYGTYRHHENVYPRLTAKVVRELRSGV